jgi:hypothetical protein
LHSDGVLIQFINLYTYQEQSFTDAAFLFKDLKKGAPLGCMPVTIHSLVDPTNPAVPPKLRPKPHELKAILHHLHPNPMLFPTAYYVPNGSPIRTNPTINVRPYSLQTLHHVPSKFSKRMVDVILQLFFDQLYIAKHHCGLGDYGIMTHSAKIVFHHSTSISLIQ